MGNNSQEQTMAEIFLIFFSEILYYFPNWFFFFFFFFPSFFYFFLIWHCVHVIVQLFSLSCLPKAHFLWVMFSLGVGVCLITHYFGNFHLLSCCSFALFFMVLVSFLVLSTALNITYVLFPLWFEILPANILQVLHCTCGCSGAARPFSLEAFHHLSDLLLFSELCIGISALSPEVVWFLPTTNQYSE